MSYDDVTSLRDEYLRRTAQSGWGEAAAVAVLLGFEPIAADERFARHVSRGRVDWDAVRRLRWGWSREEDLLIATAAGLWSGQRSDADVSRIAFLDDAQLQAWLDIIAAALTGHVPFHASAR